MSPESVGFIGAFLGAFLGAFITAFSGWILFKKERTVKFQLAALEKRLTVHQEAYTLWTELIAVIHKSDEKHSVIIKAQDWWNRNCLFLDPISRKVFKNCYMDISMYESYRGDPKELKKVFAQIMKTPEYLAKGIDLPADSETEKKMINKIEA